MKSLEYLNLDETSITDAACSDLGQLTKLKYLNINRTAVTDAGLPALDGLINLQALEAGPNVTEAAAAALLAQLEKTPGFNPQSKPQIQIWSSTGHRVVGKN
jgi:hypothetical protein